LDKDGANKKVEGCEKYFDKTGMPIDDGKIEEKPKDDGKICCKALSASCNSCAAGKSEKEYCLDKDGANMRVSGCDKYLQVSKSGECSDTQITSFSCEKSLKYPCKEGNKYSVKDNKCMDTKQTLYDTICPKEKIVVKCADK